MDLNLLELLGRKSLTLPTIELPRGVERVVVTGAGGSIGSAVVKHLIDKVEFIGLIGHSEAPIFRLYHEISERNKGTVVATKIISVGDSPELWIQEWEPDLIIHCAAYKHVGLMDSQPEAALVNNTWNTIHFARKAYFFGVPHFVFISTDKAVNPTTVMGASKRLAEAFLLSRAPYATVCRFGNVVGSSGSVVEIVYNKLLAGEPVDLTSPTMSRYFITPDEAVGLILASVSRGPGLYTLDMKSPVLIKDIIERIGQQMGRVPKIDITSPIGNEKEIEQMFNAFEHPKVLDNTDLIEVATDLRSYDVNHIFDLIANGEIDLVTGAQQL